MQVSMTVNGEEVSEEIEGRLLLVHFLRDQLGLTGTHWGCDTSNCGTCVVWMDGEPVKSCTRAGRNGRRQRGAHRRGPRAGRRARPGPAGVHGVPRAAVRFLHAGHDDDGACVARPQSRPLRTRDQRGHLGQICRCTGYATIVRSIRWAAVHESAVSSGSGS